jgi:nucleoside-diphosphate kinase
MHLLFAELWGKQMAIENTLVVIKPDGMVNGLQGQIIQIFKENDFEITHQKTIQADRKMIVQHLEYDNKPEELGSKIIKLCTYGGFDLNHTFLHGQTALDVGTTYREMIVDQMTSAPLMALLLKKENAIQEARSLCGATIPSMASPDTIRGRFSTEGIGDFLREKRAIYNVIHVASSKEETDLQRGIWFPEVTCDI